MRLRTLPLSLSGIIMGIALALMYVGVRPLPTALLCLTAVSLQILCNLSNELGDTLSGTDTDERLGIRYSLQDGDMSIGQMRRLILFQELWCCLTGGLMILAAFGKVLCWKTLAFALIGLAAIYAAKHYTLGRKPYGYRGLGDISVLVFFGFATVLGGYYLSSGGSMPGGLCLLPALAIGSFSVAVLNVNNIRDMKSDAATRVTVAMKMGVPMARRYQLALILTGWVCMTVFTALSCTSWVNWLWVATLPLYVRHLRGVFTLEDRDLDPMLPVLVMATFVFSLLALAGVILA